MSVRIPKHYITLPPKIMADVGGYGWHVSWISIDPKLGLFTTSYRNISWHKTREECEDQIKRGPPQNQWKSDRSFHKRK